MLSNNFNTKTCHEKRNLPRRDHGVIICLWKNSFVVADKILYMGVRDTIFLLFQIVVLHVIIQVLYAWAKG